MLAELKPDMLRAEGRNGLVSLGCRKHSWVARRSSNERKTYGTIWPRARTSSVVSLSFNFAPLLICDSLHHGGRNSDEFLRVSRDQYVHSAYQAIFNQPDEGPPQMQGRSPTTATALPQLEVYNRC